MMTLSNRAVTEIRAFRRAHPTAETKKVKAHMVKMNIKADFRSPEARTLMEEPVSDVVYDESVKGDKKRAALDWMRKHPDSTPQDIINGVNATYGIDVSKTTAEAARRDVKNSPNVTVSGGSDDDYNDLVSAKKFAKSVGGIDNALRILRNLESFQIA
jgi:hypothetical protein